MVTESCSINNQNFLKQNTRIKSIASKQNEVAADKEAFLPSMFKYSDHFRHDYDTQQHSQTAVALSNTQHHHQQQQQQQQSQQSQQHSNIQHFPALIPPYTVLLKDGETTATIYPIPSPQALPPGLLAFLVDEFNMEVERGDTFPFFDTLDIEEFKNYWFGSFAAVMVLGDEPILDHQRSWEKECLGSFFIKANFPGRASHICTGGFLVNAGIRGKGIGRTLTELFLDWAPKLGYTSSIFNLVFETNVGARRILESLNFKRIGKIKAAGILKDHENAVDALIYGKELNKSSSTANGNRSHINPHIDHSNSGYRFDKIKYYLEFGKYPPFIDRHEKSRLRSSASHYRLIDGKLTLNGKEVISDPVRQLQICEDYHSVNHGGINKTTSTINEKFHWTRIKDTVAQAIKNCTECSDPSRNSSGISSNKRQKVEGDNNNANSINVNNNNVNVSNQFVQEHLNFQNMHDDGNVEEVDTVNIFDVVNTNGTTSDNQPQGLDQQNSHHHHHINVHHVHGPDHLQNVNVQSLQSVTQSYENYDQNTGQTERVGLDEKDQRTPQIQSINEKNEEEIPVDPEVSSYQYQSAPQHSQSSNQINHTHNSFHFGGQRYSNQDQQQSHQDHRHVETADDEGAEIEIARALIEANDDDDDDN